MASIDEVASGTQTAVIATTHSLASLTAAETYVLVVNLVNMASGDTVVLKAKAKVIGGGSSSVAFEQTFTGDQTEEIVYCEPVPSAHEVEFTLRQSAGTGRQFEWSVLRVVHA